MSRDELALLSRGPVIGSDTRPGDGVIEVVDPANEMVIAAVRDATVADGLAAVDVAQRAFGPWRRTPPRERAEILRRAYELIAARQASLARLIVQENGKALPDARAEVAYAAEFFRWYAEEAVRLVGTMQTAPAGSNSILVLREPVGVSLLVTPWNFPAAMAARKIAPALAAGCTVILKPASETPLTALALHGILAEAGVPDGVVSTVPSSRSAELVSALLDHASVRKLSFTGSTEVGRTLLGRAARTVVNTSMELGGNAPFLVLSDADMADAVRGALVAKFRNGGSACTAANRFLVHRSRAAEFTERLAHAVRSLGIGPGLDAGTDIGPLISEKARSKVAALVEGAVREGAEVLVGGAVPDRIGYFYEPTVLCDVPPDAGILREEIFGPVAPVTVFDEDDEAVAMANDTSYGLVSYVYTADQRRGMRMADRLDAGMVGLNRPVVSDPAAPFGGTKQSGLGREGGHDGMLAFVESKYVALEW